MEILTGVVDDEVRSGVIEHVMLYLRPWTVPNGLGGQRLPHRNEVFEAAEAVVKGLEEAGYVICRKQ